MMVHTWYLSYSEGRGRRIMAQGLPWQNLLVNSGLLKQELMKQALNT
jgi:hypothetical protein